MFSSKIVKIVWSSDDVCTSSIQGVCSNLVKFEQFLEKLLLKTNNEINEKISM